MTVNNIIAGIGLVILLAGLIWYARRPEGKCRGGDHLLGAEPDACDLCYFWHHEP